MGRHVRLETRLREPPVAELRLAPVCRKTSTIRCCAVAAFCTRWVASPLGTRSPTPATGCSAVLSEVILRAQACPTFFVNRFSQCNLNLTVGLLDDSSREWCIAFGCTARGEPGENPGLTRSGIQERPPSSALVAARR